MPSLSSTLSQISFSSPLNGPSPVAGSRPDSSRPTFSSNPDQSRGPDFGTEAEPFARTLQNRINSQPPANPQRQPGNDSGDGARRAASGSESASNDGAPRSEGAHREPPAGTRDTSASSRYRPVKAADEASALTESAATEEKHSAAAAIAADLASTPADASAPAAVVDAGQVLPEPSMEGDPAAMLAGLPAAFAVPNQAITETAPPEADPLLEGGGHKRAADPLLQAKTDARTGGVEIASDADADASAPPLLRARQPVTTAPLAERFAAAATAPVTEEGGAKTLSAASSSTGQTHGVQLFNMLRPSPASPSATPQLPVQTPAGAQAWAEDVGNQVRWMLGRAESKAELVLTPPNLGKLEVSISLSGDQTTAQFVASSQAARDALEQALPRLREMLQQAGIQLGQANVSTSGEQPAQGGDEGGRGGGRGGEGQIADAASESSHGQWLRRHDGMVDTFA